MALLMTLGAIVIVGALVAGAFAVSTRDVRTARAAGSREVAQLRAENALIQLRAQFQLAPPTNAQLPVGAVLSMPAPAVGLGRARVARLGNDVYMITAEDTAGVGAAENTARKRVSMVLVRNVPSMNFMGALTVRGATQIGGASFIDGTDSDPTGWSCPDPQLPQKPGIVTPNSSSITYSGCNSGDCVEGNPKVQQNAAAGSDATYFSYGSVGWEDLKNRAMRVPAGNMKIQPSFLAGGACNTADSYNWGDPLRAGGKCEGHFPIIYVTGDARINGVRGQGVLLVEGDLEVQGGFEFYGPVIAKGRLKTTGTGGHFNGGVMAANVDLEQNQVLGNAVISFSNCAIQTALRMSAPLTPVRQRAWADMF